MPMKKSKRIPHGSGQYPFISNQKQKWFALGKHINQKQVLVILRKIIIKL